LAIGVPAWGLSLDFTEKKPWRKAHNKVTRTFEVETGLEMTIGANKRKITWNKHDGYGIKGGYQDDEFDPHELFVMSFSETVWLDGIVYTDLFGRRLERSDWDGEVAFVTLDDGTQLGPYRGGTHPNGVIVVDLPRPLLIKSMAFWAPVTAVRDFNDHSLGGITYHRKTTSVPEPETLILLALGLAFLVVVKSNKIPYWPAAGKVTLKNL